MTSKVCVECLIEKAATQFRRMSSQKDGLHYWCKACTSAWEKGWRKKHPDAVRAINQRNYQKHRLARIASAKEYYESNIPSVRDAQRAYEWRREKEDLNFKMRRRLRTQIRNTLLNRDGAEKQQSTLVLLGCSIEDFRAHLGKQFKSGMTWENWGAVWEIGHKKPVASFDLSDPGQHAECWNFSNLFPHFAEQNRSDGAKYHGVDFRGLKPADFLIGEIPLAKAKELVEKHHYAHSSPSAATVCFGLFSQGHDFLGAAIFRPAVWGVAKSISPNDPQSVLCLSRFVLTPALPKNSASYFLSQCIRRLKLRPKIKTLVTFADTWQGHDGCIYKASNWQFKGPTPPQPVWTLNGKLIGLRQGKTTLTEQNLRERGAVFHGEFPKLKFVYPLV